MIQAASQHSVLVTQLSSQRLDRNTLGRLCEQLESVLHLQSPPQQQVLVAEESASILVEHLSRYRA